jgi:hypothetical protein
MPQLSLFNWLLAVLLSFLNKLLAVFASLLSSPKPSEQSSSQPFRLMELPWDVRRLAFEKAPSKTWRRIPVGHPGLYYATLSKEVSLLQVSHSVNEEASFAKQHSQADQPCILVISPQYVGMALALLKAIATARTHDEIYLKTVPADEKPMLAITKWTAELPFDSLMRSVGGLSQEAITVFITQVMLQLRRKQKIHLRLLVTRSDASGTVVSVFTPVKNLSFCSP